MTDRYFRRWLVAVFVVTPILFALVPAADLLIDGVEGIHAEDPFWFHYLGMIGFYGGYAPLAATAASLLHTRLLRRSAAVGRVTQIGWGVGLGVLVLVPQALVFGPEYWLVNALAGAVGGAIYGVLVTFVRCERRGLQLR